MGMVTSQVAEVQKAKEKQRRDFYAVLTEDDMKSIKQQSEIQDAMASGFTVEVGKVSKKTRPKNFQTATLKEKAERNKLGVNLTYGEFSCESIFEVFRWLQRT
jgi:hypoxanthine-guanine phosphoribosyltransferase